MVSEPPEPVLHGARSGPTAAFWGALGLGMGTAESVPFPIPLLEPC